MDNNMVWNDQTARMIRQGEMIEAAKVRRNLAFASQLNRRRIHQSALSRIGKMLSTVGGRLQERYDTTEEPRPYRRDYRPGTV